VANELYIGNKLEKVKWNQWEKIKPSTSNTSVSLNSKRRTANCKLVVGNRLLRHSIFAVNGQEIRQI